MGLGRLTKLHLHVIMSMYTLFTTTTSIGKERLFTICCNCTLVPPVVYKCLVAISKKHQEFPNLTIWCFKAHIRYLLEIISKIQESWPSVLFSNPYCEPSHNLPTNTPASPSPKCLVTFYCLNIWLILLVCL